MREVLIVDDDELLRRAFTRHLQRRSAVVVYEAGTIGEATRALAAHPEVDLVLLDIGLPDGGGLEVLARMSETARRPPTIVMTGEATLESAVGAMRAGVIDYLLKPFSMEALDAAIARVLEPDPGRPGAIIDAAAVEAWRAVHAPTLLGRATLFIEVLDVVRRVAPSDCPVLVSGETGTGKELVARALHAASARAAGPFHAINCAAVPEALLESELFGHARGSFTGASHARTGRFVAASGGTLFLDEIGDLTLGAQAKLLRALQEKEVVPVGGDQAIQVDVRIVAATHRDLEQMVASGLFRADLLYRLDVIRVDLPPLRSRRTDIPLLVEALVQEIAQRRNPRVTGIERRAVDLLGRYDWPGNVRQLQNVLERMVLLADGGLLTPNDIPVKLRGEPVPEPTTTLPVLPGEGLDLRESVERFEGALIRQALDRTGWNRNQAAALLGTNRTTLVEKLRRRGWTEHEQDE